MAERADNFYQPKPGTDLVWLSAVTKYIIDNDLHDKAFVDEWVNGFEGTQDDYEYAMRIILI